MALDSRDQPHIFFNGIDYVYYVSWDQSTLTWDYRIVAPTQCTAAQSLSLDGNDTPHMSYDDWRGNLGYSSWTGSGWSYKVVDTSGTVGGYTGLYITCLALDHSGNPHISYCDSTDALVKYASWDGSAWNTQTVDSIGNNGGCTSLALDSSGNPHISYYDTTNSVLKYASWDGSSWNIQNVAPSGNGWMNSLALDSEGNPNICYFDANNHLMYATLHRGQSARANFTWSPLVPVVGDIVTFNGSSSTTPDGGTIVSYAWDFGDGGAESGQMTTHLYSVVGNYTVTLNVTDSNDLWDVHQEQVMVIQQQYNITFGQMGVGSDFTGTVLTIDGTNYTASALPASFWWDEGSSHSFSFASPLNMNASRGYCWWSTSGLSSFKNDTLTVTASGNVTATFGLIGDINHDGKVSLTDLVMFATAYSSHPGDPNWNPECDLAAPYGVIGLSDLVTLAIHYGQHYP